MRHDNPVAGRWSAPAAVLTLLVALVCGQAADVAATSSLVEVEPNNSYETANPIAYGQTYEGDVNPGCEDIDLFAFHGSAGDHVQASVEATGGSPLSPLLAIDDGQRRLASGSDWSRYGYNRLVYMLPAEGDYYLSVVGLNEEGGDGCDGAYTLQLSEALIFSTAQNATVGSLAFAKSDIVAYDQTKDTWEMLYDMSDVGVEDNIAAFFMLQTGTLWFAPVEKITTSPNATGYISQPIEPQDLAVFQTVEFGSETNGNFYFHEDERGGFDGSDAGLTTSGEAIDAAAVDGKRRIVISTKGNCSVPGVPACADEDLIVFNPTSLGTDTAGDWEMLFDGSDIGLGPGDIRGVWLSQANDDIYFTLESAVTLGGLAITPDDIVHCQGGRRGDETSCAALAIDWSATAHGLTKALDGLAFGVNDQPADSGMIDLTVWATPPAAGLTFTLTGDLGEFTMAHSEGRQFEVPTGEYAVTVQPQEDWGLDIICRKSASDVPDDPIEFDPGTRTVTIPVDLGDWIDCDVFNILPVWYVSAPGSGVVDGIAFDRSDILAYYPGTDAWEMRLDGSEAGISQNLTAFSNLFNSPGGILMSIGSPRPVPDPSCGVTTRRITPQDVVRYLWDDYFEFAFDGSDVGLTQSGETIDAIGVAPDGRLLISTTGTVRVPGIVAQDEDILAFDGEQWGYCDQETVGSWELYFDGSTLPGFAQEDVVGLAVDARGDIFLTLQDRFTVGGVKCGPSCVIVVHPDGTVAKAWDARASRFPLKLDGIDVPYSGRLNY